MFTIVIFVVGKGVQFGDAVVMIKLSMFVRCKNPMCVYFTDYGIYCIHIELELTVTQIRLQFISL